MSESNKTVNVILIEQQKAPTFKLINGLTLGFIYSMISSIMSSISTIFLKKTVFFNGVDNSIMRSLVIAIFSIPIAKNKGLSIFSSKNPNKYLIITSINSITVILFFVALRLISPSDAVSLLNTNILYLAILSRILFKEKFSIIHLLALSLVLSGTIFITQPSFIFREVIKIFVSNY